MRSVVDSILKGILTFFSIFLLMLVYFMFDSLIKNKYKKNFEWKVLEVIDHAKIKFSTKDDFEQFKKELSYILSTGFKVYYSTSVFNENLKENFCVITDERIVGFRVYITDQAIEYKNEKIIGSKGLEIKVPKSIKIFDLSGNILAWFKISDFERLEKLNLRNCRLGSLELTNLPSLKELDFSWNEPLEKINISNLKNLEKIYINSSLKEIVLSELDNIRYIDFSDYNIERVVFSNMPSLEKLNLKGSRLIEVNLYNLPSLKELNLNKNKNIRNFQVKDVDNITTLKLSETNIDDKIIDDINSRLSSIRELDISYNFNLRSLDLSKLHLLNKLKISGSFYIEKIVLSKEVKNSISIDGLNNKTTLIFK